MLFIVITRGEENGRHKDERCNMSYKDISVEMHISRLYAYKLHERALIEFDSILEDDDA